MKLKRRYTKWYGWKPDIPDARDHLFKLTAPIALPPAIDLRPSCPPIVDQGSLGSCTANAIAGAFAFDEIKQGFNPVNPRSRLFIYYSERQIEGTIGEDSGAQIRDGIKAIATLGTPSEAIWPYDISKFAVRPSLGAYKNAANHKALKYERVMPTEEGIFSALASGFPIVFGFTVYSSFESQAVAQSGVVPMPDLANEEVLGGHAVVMVGYDKQKGIVIVRNSWGTGWGMDGYFTMPIEYVTHPGLADDFWIVTAVK